MSKRKALSRVSLVALAIGTLVLAASCRTWMTRQDYIDARANRTARPTASPIDASDLP